MQSLADFNKIIQLLNPVQCLALLILVVSVVKLLWIGRRDRSLPPGPPTLPIIGNLHQTSRSDVHVLYTEWAQQYGGIFSLKNGSGTTIVLTDRTVVKQLLDKRGANYADRPDSYVLNELVTGGHHLLPMRYGERWRKLRRVIQQELSEARCDQKHLPLQHAEATQMLADFMESPQDFKLHPKRFSTSVMTSTVCGVRMGKADVHFMKYMDQMFYELVSTTSTGASPPVDQVPLFKYLPDSLWNNWHSKALAVSSKLKKFYGEVIERVAKRRALQGSSPSFLDHVLENQAKYGVTDKELIFLCGTLLEGGSDTSSATMQVFLEAIVTHPEVQRQAHAQIDAAFDAHTMPSWADYNKLPYISQIIKETLRWRPISPTAFPHATTSDDHYEGYFIPARSTVIINVYGLHRDPKHFPDPDVFDPNRFAGLTAPAGALANAADPETGRDHYGYGAGRRICPGIHLAERNLFIGISRLLWAFEFEKVADEGEGEAETEAKGKDKGKGQGESDSKGKLDGGNVINGPGGIRCRIKIRSEARQDTILGELERIKAEVFSKYDVEE